MKRGIVWVLLLSLVGLGGVLSASAVDFSSSSYKINGSLGDSIAGGQSSTNYQLTSVGGESIAGTTASTNYKLGQGYTPRLENSIQLVVQSSIGLRGYWPLDNATPNATAFDEAIFDRNGTYSAGSSSVAGKIGTAWSDTSAAQSVTIPHGAGFPSGNKASIIAWAKPSSSLTQRAIITKWDAATNPTNGEWALQTGSTATELRFYVGSNGDSGSNYVDTTNANLTPGVFSHIVVTYDGTLANAQRVKIYVNGIQTSTTTTGTIPTTLNTTPANPITIGSFPGLGRYWSGAVDEVKYFNTALSDVEAKDEYNATNAGIPMSLRIPSPTPGTPLTNDFFLVTQTSAPRYTVAINQSGNLTSGSNTIPAISSTIASPAAWVNGTTKGLGFTVVESDPVWNSGSVFAAIPNVSTSFLTRNSAVATKDLVNMQLKLDVTAAQPSGDYTSSVTLTGTMLP